MISPDSDSHIVEIGDQTGAVSHRYCLSSAVLYLDYSGYGVAKLSTC